MSMIMLHILLQNICGKSQVYLWKEKEHLKQNNIKNEIVAENRLQFCNRY